MQAKRVRSEVQGSTIFTARDAMQSCRRLVTYLRRLATFNQHVDVQKGLSFGAKSPKEP